MIARKNLAEIENHVVPLEELDKHSRCHRSFRVILVWFPGCLIYYAHVTHLELLLTDAKYPDPKYYACHSCKSGMWLQHIA